jgi:hypothetical protein
VVVLVKGPVDWVPDTALAPDQPPEARHDDALLDDHVRVDEAPLVTEAGSAVRETVGAVVVVTVTVTVVDALCVPPGPLHERLNVLLFVSGPVDWLPEVALLPDHAPDAVQEVALVEDHVSVEAPPLTVTVVGFAEIATVGRGAGGGVPETVT